MNQPIVTLTTDFGDNFALAQLEAVLLAENPAIKTITIANDVSKFSILEGAFILSRTCGLFPKGTIHVGVVDPGVGSEREAIIIKAHDHIFIGPNNGLFYQAVCNYDPRIYRINEKAVMPNYSNTFQGRDIFAKAAGILTKSSDVNELCYRECDSILIPLAIEPNQVVHIDDYGNIKINTHCGNFSQGTVLDVCVNGCHRQVPFVQTFSDVAAGELLAYRGSHDILEIAKNLGAATDEIGVSIGDVLSIQPHMHYMKNVV